MNYAATSSSSSFPNAKPFIGVVENTIHALRLVHAARQGVIPRIVRRLNDSERRDMIRSGAVFVFSVEESGIKRWTDGRLWSPSRIVGNFLVYKEMCEKSGNRAGQKNTYPAENISTRADTRLGIVQWDGQDQGSLRSSRSSGVGSNNNGLIKPNGLIKKTITVTIDGSDLHLISYYTQDDIRSRRLRRLSSRPDIISLELQPQIFRFSSFRNPPKVTYGQDGRPTIVCEPEEPEPSESLTEKLPDRISRSPEAPGDAEHVKVPQYLSDSVQRQSLHHPDSRAPSSSGQLHGSGWRGRQEDSTPMVSQLDSQSPRWHSSLPSGMQRSDGQGGYQRSNGMRVSREHPQQNWPTPSHPQLSANYHSSSGSNSLMYRSHVEEGEREGASSGLVYESMRDTNQGVPTLYGNTTAGSSADRHVGYSHEPLWNTSNQNSASVSESPTGGPLRVPRHLNSSSFSAMPPQEDPSQWSSHQSMELQYPEQDPFLGSSQVSEQRFYTSGQSNTAPRVQLYKVEEYHGD